MALVDKHKVKRQRLDRICEGKTRGLAPFVSVCVDLRCGSVAAAEWYRIGWLRPCDCTYASVPLVPQLYSYMLLPDTDSFHRVATSI